MRRILAIDGGGIRGLIPAVVCQRLEAWSRTPIHELFDLIAGSSTGGILALGLASPPNGKTAESIVNLFKDEGPHIFSRPRGFIHHLKGPKYSSEKLEHALLSHFGSLKLSEAIVDVLVTAYDIQQRRPIYFTWAQGNRSADDDYLMREVALGTSAAPTYFAPARVGAHVVIDGGLVANNPAGVAYAQAKRLWPNEELLLISLGTGTLTSFISPTAAKSWGTLYWLKNIIDCTFDGNSKATEDFFTHTHLEHYWRFQGGLSQATQELDGVSQGAIAGLQQIGEGIASTNERHLLELIELLKRAGIRLTAKITWPHRETIVPCGKCRVNGSIEGYAGEILYLFTGTNGKYWPSSRISPQNGQWQGDVHLGTTSPEATITLAAVDGRLAEYIEFYRSHAEAINYIGIPIHETLNHLDRIHVIVSTVSKQ
jgi:uncharacterized protein